VRSELFWQWFEDFAAPRLAEWKDRGMDRSDTFRKMFEHLDKYDRGVRIVETGCVEEADNWRGNGCSTILFDRYAATHPGTVVHSFEIDGEKAEEARKYCPHVHFVVGDSVEMLKLHVYAEVASREVQGLAIDLLYLDASAHNWAAETLTQVHHFNELMAAMPLLRENSLVAVDDCIVVLDEYPQTKVIGKGGIVAQYALEAGAEMVFSAYQIGFTHMTGGRAEWKDISELIDRARAHVEAGERLQADRLYRMVMTLTPPPWIGKGSGVSRIARGEACANFARNAHKMKQYGVASDWFGMALAADPLAVDYHCELARSFVGLGSMKAARRQAEIATEVEPENPVTWATLGGVASDMLDISETLEAYDRQVQAAAMGQPFDPKAMSDAYINRASIAVDIKDYVTAIKMCRYILELGVRIGDAWGILAMIEYRLSNHERAIEFFDKALANDCRNQPLTHWNKSLPLQSIGRLRESWKEHVWREFEPNIPNFYVPYHRFTKPKWEGQTGPGVVHVHTEAGHGDNIAMLRYLPMIQERGLTVHYEADPKLLSLVERNFPKVVCMPRAVDYPGCIGIKPFDWHHPIGDLPHVFDTDIDSIPWRGPYLRADPFTVKRMDSRFPAGRRRIGLCWSSGIRRHASIWMTTYGSMKSMPLKELVPLFDDYEDVFVSLQVGDGRDEIDHRIHPILDVLSDDPTWDETAAVIANLDLVITVDTGVAHLAGAMGVPTWVVMQKDGASWHFMCEREGAFWNMLSPWYPSVRIFRQGDGTWRSAVERVREALEAKKWT